MVGDIEKCFVDGEPLDVGCDAAEDAKDRLRDRLVDLKSWAHELQGGTQAHSLSCAHGRSHAEFSCFVARGSDHTAPFGCAPDRHRHAPEVWVIPLFDRCEKGIHVDVQDAPDGGWMELVWRHGRISTRREAGCV